MRAAKYMKHAKPLKKQTKMSMRREKARQKAKMFTVAAILFSQSESTKRLNQLTKQEEAQLDRIAKWSLAAIDTMHREKPLGVGIIQEGQKKGKLVDRAIESRMPAKKISFEDHAARWIAFSLLADDTRTNMGNGSREWNFLAGCVATWVNMVLRQADSPEKAEELGGELGELAWEIILR